MSERQLTIIREYNERTHLTFDDGTLITIEHGLNCISWYKKNPGNWTDRDMSGIFIYGEQYYHHRENGPAFVTSSIEEFWFEGRYYDKPIYYKMMIELGCIDKDNGEALTAII